MRHLLWGLLLGTAPFLNTSLAGDDEDNSSPKGALQALNEFIGEWKGSGAPEKRRVERGESWEETVSWSWRFKGDDVALAMAVKNGRYLKSGELRYVPDKKRYQFTAIDKKDSKLAFNGELKDGYL